MDQVIDVIENMLQNPLRTLIFFVIDYNIGYPILSLYPIIENFNNHSRNNQY